MPRRLRIDAVSLVLGALLASERPSAAAADEASRDKPAATESPSAAEALFAPPGVGGVAAANVAMLPPVEDGGALESDLFGAEDASNLTERPTAGGGMPRGTRAGFFQKVTLDSRWVPALSSDQPTVADVSATVLFAAPAPSRESPLLMTPGFGSHSIGGPTTFDLPEQLYDASFDVGWMSRLNDRWGVNLGVTPGIYSDFEQTDGDALRIAGRLLFSWNWTPTTQVIFGAVYLDRPDVPALPAAGITWTPTDDWRLDLLAPRPKVARRMAYSDDLEHWLYVSGEFGGGNWAVERASGAHDNLSYRAYHLLAGWERKNFEGISGLLEFGLAFGRRFEYEHGGEVFNPDPSLLLRGRVQY